MVILTLKDPEDLLLPQADFFELRPDRTPLRHVEGKFITTGFTHPKAAYVDIPLGKRIKAPSSSTKIIHSYHGTVHDPRALFLTMNVAGVDFVKIVPENLSLLDYVELIPLLEESQGKLALFGTGEQLQATRLLSYFFGAPLLYTSTDRFCGQISYDTLFEQWQIQRFTSLPKLLGLVKGKGVPTLSDREGNAHLASRGIDALYLPLPLERGQVARLLRSPYFHGFALTMPFKIEAFEVSTSDAPGSVNSWYRGIGYNTDIAILDALEPLQGKRLSILGAGGVGRAFAQEAKRRGAIVTLSVRNPKAIDTLVEHLEVACTSLDKIPPYEILIDATPVPDLLKTINPNATILDVKVESNPLYRTARRFLGGRELFDVQHRKQLELFELLKSAIGHPLAL